MSGTFLDKLKGHAKQLGIRGGTRAVLQILHVKEGMSPDEIARLFGVSSALVRVRLKEAGVYKLARPGFEERVKAAGYKSVDVFFAENGVHSIAEMGAKVGLSFGGIQHHYRKWLAKAARGKHVKK